MNVLRRPVDLVHVLNASANARSAVERATAMALDTSRTERLAAQECQYCFYTMKVGGAAMTHSACGICGVEQLFGSTNVNRLCVECAREHRLCVHCAGDINMKNRRKLTITKPSAGVSPENL